MLIWGEFFKTQCDQNIPQNAPYFQNFLGQTSIFPRAPPPPASVINIIIVT